MENSQKALLIAGAILLAILMISLGIYIYTISSNSIELSAIDELSIKVANSEFEQYEGRQSGGMVVKLLDKVIEYNKDYSKDESYSIGICSNDTRIINKISSTTTKNALTRNISGRKSGVYWEDNIRAIQKVIVKSQYYKISFDYNDLNGYIYIVHIDAPN